MRVFIPESSSVPASRSSSPNGVTQACPSGRYSAWSAGTPSGRRIVML